MKAGTEFVILGLAECRLEFLDVGASILHSDASLLTRSLAHKYCVSAAH